MRVLRVYPGVCLWMSGRGGEGEALSDVTGLPPPSGRRSRALGTPGTPHGLCPQDGSGAMLPQPAGGAVLHHGHQPGQRAGRLRPAARQQRQPRGHVREGERPGPGALSSLLPELGQPFPLSSRVCRAPGAGRTTQISPTAPVYPVNSGRHPRVAAHRVWFPDQRLNPGPLHWVCRLSTAPQAPSSTGETGMK